MLDGVNDSFHKTSLRGFYNFPSFFTSAHPLFTLFHVFPPITVTSTVRDLKSLVLSLQETEKDKEGYPEKAEGMLATAIAGER